MLEVISPDEVFKLIKSSFTELPGNEEIELSEALSRVAAEDISSDEYIPDFDRSTVDGYAIKASDSFGCSEAIPAVLTLQGKIEMGEAAEEALKEGCCFAVPTGGFIPKGADAVVMIEDSENYNDGSIGILVPAAPGKNHIPRGDELKPGDIIIHKGRRLSAADIGALASAGKVKIKVKRKLLVGIISTGDELVPAERRPGAGQIRNVNSPLLAAAVREAGALHKDYGAVKDDEALISQLLDRAVVECDMVLISGGSSAGEKDRSAKLIEQKGELLFHGIAMKPGKPTMLGKIKGKPVFGIAGHPGAAFFIATVFVKPLIRHMTGESPRLSSRKAVLSEAVSSNHGRAEYIGVRLDSKDGVLSAEPVLSKSGLISSLAEIDAYMLIARDCEGMEKNSSAEVFDVI